MKKVTIMVALAWLGLAGCDRLGFGQKDSADINGSAEAEAGNESRADAGSAQNGISDAGITRSRSFAGLTGGGTGGKEPGAIPASAQGPIQAGLLVGRWSDDGNCKQDFEFLPDGTFRTFEGVEGGWSLDGETLTLTGTGDPLQVNLRMLDADRLVVVNADGTTGQSTRC
jgi:hypothetical protein